MSQVDSAEREDTVRRIKNCIVTSLGLDTSPEEIRDDAQLFAPESVGGLGLDSLAALEIFVSLSKEFGLRDREIDAALFVSPSTLADWVLATPDTPAD